MPSPGPGTGSQTIQCPPDPPLSLRFNHSCLNHGSRRGAYQIFRLCFIQTNIQKCCLDICSTCIQAFCHPAFRVFLEIPTNHGPIFFFGFAWGGSAGFSDATPRPGSTSTSLVAYYLNGALTYQRLKFCCHSLLPILEMLIYFLIGNHVKSRSRAAAFFTLSQREASKAPSRRETLHVVKFHSTNTA